MFGIIYQQNAYMSLEIALPIHIEQHLQTEWGNEFPRRAAEALAIEGYRTGALSLGEVAEMLDFSINEADSETLEEILAK